MEGIHTAMIRDIFFSSRRYAKTILLEQWVAEAHARGEGALIVHLDGRLERRHPDGTTTWSKQKFKEPKGRNLMIFDEKAWKVLIPEGER